MFKFYHLILALLAMGIGGLIFPIKDAYSLSKTMTEDAAYDGPTEVFLFKEPFYIPIVRNGIQEEIVLIQLALEIKEGTQEHMRHVAPKLRHGVLTTLYKHYHEGHFSASYMDKSSVEAILNDLNTQTREASDHVVQNVLLQSMRKQML